MNEMSLSLRALFWAWAGELLVHAVLQPLSRTYRLKWYVAIPWFLFTITLGFLAVIMTREFMGRLEWMAVVAVMVTGMVYEYRGLKKNLGLAALALPCLAGGVVLTGVMKSFWLFHYSLTNVWWIACAEVVLFVIYRSRLLEGSLYRIGLSLGLGYGLLLASGLAWFMITPKMRCDQGEIIQPVITSCQVSNWANMHESLPGAPPKPDAGIRDAAITDEGNVVSVNGTVDHNHTTAPVILYEGRARKAILWAESPVAVVCPQGTTKCVIASSMTDSVFVVDSSTLEVLQSYYLEGHSPAEMDVTQTGEVAMMLLPSRSKGSGKPPVPNLDPQKIRTVKVAASQKYVKATFSLDDGFTSFVGQEADALTNMGSEMFYNRLLPNGEVLFGDRPRFSRKGELERVSAGFFWDIWTGGITAGAVVTEGRFGQAPKVYVNYTFGGIAEFTPDMKFVRWLTHRNGGRWLEYDAKNHLLLSGFYDDGLLIAYREKTGEEVGRVSIGGSVRHMKVVPEKRELVVAAGVGGVSLVNIDLFPTATAIASAAPQ